MTRSRPLVAFVVAIAFIAGMVLPVAAQTQQPGDFNPFAQPVAHPGGTLPSNPAIQLVKVADGLADPVNIAAPPDGSGRIFVVERVGEIRIIDKDGKLLDQPFLDLRNSVKIDFLEQGLLGLAFHPDYQKNGLFYVYYSDYQTNGRLFLVEYKVSADDPNKADPDSGRVLFTVDDPYVNHNGGTLHFGPDGFLYIAIGDGGLAGDPYDNAQDLSNLLGKILRVDVNGRAVNNAYSIPPDNPFADQGQVRQSSVANQAAQTGAYHPDARPEIWAYGLRNPWQFSFDPKTGDLYIADVGQNVWEEINYQPGGSKGGQNYGWDHMEGAHCYPPLRTLPGTPAAGVADSCDPFGTPPVAEYSHSVGGCSITGIGVYRGQESPALDGIYFNSDFCSGKVFGLARDQSGNWVYQELLDTTLLVTGAGQDANGDLYLTSCNCQFSRDYNPFANPQGAVWRIVAADKVPQGAETAPPEAPQGTPEATPSAALPSIHGGIAAIDLEPRAFATMAGGRM
ncbi:MAG TPA: PQQ-dependent sugar dehydrogenase [Thermomicrobiales bacterium]|nr:PQQ-dependent sugar dehydrogenase [Thermomicrobiales bacterium]